MIIIDSDVLIEIFDKGSEKGEVALQKIEKTGEDIAITSLSLHEVLYGHHKIGKKIKGIMQINTIEFNKSDAELSAKLEIEAEKRGRMISRIDTMIAAVVINRKAKIYTFNKKHFQTFKQIRLFN